MSAAVRNGSPGSSSHSPSAGAPARRLLLIAAAALIAGVVVYVVDRAAGSTYFLPAALSLADGHRPWFGALGGQLPDFLHAYALSLLTAAALAGTRGRAAVGCLAWWAIDSLFEFGQHPAIKGKLACAVPAWFDGIPFLENARAFFARGTFDPADLLAIAGGASGALLTILIVQSHPGDRHDERR